MSRDTGTVVEFDERVGLGVVETSVGRRLRFHAMEITDGSRRIGVGTPVRFVIRAGQAGEWEATAVGSDAVRD